MFAAIRRASSRVSGLQSPAPPILEIGIRKRLAIMATDESFCRTPSGVRARLARHKPSPPRGKRTHTKG
jgi:hypothetical protein